MATTTPTRTVAFKSGATYYIFNKAKTGLIAIPFKETDPDYTLWEDINDLNNLSAQQCLLISGMSMYIHSNIDDDAYKVSMGTYSVLETTDTTHYALTGYGGINSIDITGSETCRVLLSFDGRQTWHRYDTKTSKWLVSHIDDIYSEGNTVKEVNSFNKAIYALLFKKNCTLDYAISVTNTENITSVVLNLPENSAPVIELLEITANQTTHKLNVAFKVEVDDPEGDNISYRITRKFGNNKEIELETGDLPPVFGDLTYVFDPADWEIGNNVITFTYTDEKGKFSSKSITVTKVNEPMSIVTSYDKGKINYLIDDKDHDGGKFKIELNGEVLEDYQSSYMDVPISGAYEIPAGKVKFGETNTLKIYYKENIYNAPEQVSVTTFEGKYYGVLFVDVSNTDPDSNNKPNKEHYYSTSLGEFIKSLKIPPVYCSRESSSYEVGLINTSDTDYSKVTVYPTVVNTHYSIKISTTNSPFTPMDSITFTDVKQDEEKPRTFFVKVISNDETSAIVNDKIELVASND